MPKLLWIILLWGMVFQVTAQSVVINEYMASNGSTLSDEDGSYEDWIELYNYGEETVPLEGFFLSDDFSNPYKWMFPEVSIHPGQYLLIWASGKDRNHPGAPLHTNFSLSRTGEELFITSASGERLDETGPFNLPRDISLARYPNGTGSWFYNSQPTPGTENQPVNTEHQVVAFWLMDNNLPNNIPLQSIQPTFSLLQDARIHYHSSLEGYPFEPGHPLWRKASMERRNLPTPLNYQPSANNDQAFGQVNMRGLQIKQPFRANSLENIIELDIPTTGFTDISLGFAAVDEGAADSLIIEYSTASGSDASWMPVSEMNGGYPVGPGYQLYGWDLSAVPQVNNNPYFKVRIRFSGSNLTEDNGNRVTFNNFSVHARPLAIHQVRNTTANGGLITPYGFTQVYDGDELHVTIFPTRHHVINQFFVNNADLVAELQGTNNNIAHYQLKNITENIRIHVTFKLDDEYIARQKDGILIFPNPSGGNINVRSESRIFAITVRNINGAVVYRAHGLDTREFGFQLEVVQGFYALEMEYEGGISVKKLQIVY